MFIINSQIFNLDCQRNQQLVGLYEISNDL